MGNEKSTLRHLEIDKKCIETNDSFTLFNAACEDYRQLSVFVGENIVPGQLWTAQTPIERASKNLMVFRHPFILKYITSWDQHLATERVQPLTRVMGIQTDIQVCLGLRNILCALIFLVEQANARHLNIALSSVYVNSEGEWRLGGFEYVWKAKDLNMSILELAKSHRNKDYIDPNEISKFSQDQSVEGLEQYAFATLCEEILKNSKNSNTPYIVEFRDYCATHLKHQNILMRPKLSAVLLHPFFNHEFILIHSFLTELPLKSPQEKQDFFTNLVDRLKYFDENVVGCQIGNLLLSRMVLLDNTADQFVTPNVLKPKSETNLTSLFSPTTYTKYIIPRIKKVFCVRDSQIRLILLDYFLDWAQQMSEEELKDEILPNLLLGIKDTNDMLVAKTLRCLADLVPILGSSIVIGGKRGRLFADGRPQDIRTPTIIRKLNKTEPRSITPVLNSTSAGLTVSDYLGNPIPDCNESFVSPLLLADSVISHNSDNSILKITTFSNINVEDNCDEDDSTSFNNSINMPERPSPDGGEDEKIQTTIDRKLNLSSNEIDDTEDLAWSDWENENDHVSPSIMDKNLPEINVLTDNLDKTHFDRKHSVTSDIKDYQKSKLSESKKVNDDINELDIKIKKFSTKNQSEEFDYFKDMEPVIKSNISIIDEKEMQTINKETSVDRNDYTRLENDSILTNIEIDNSLFELKLTNDVVESGWGDDEDVEIEIPNNLTILE